MKTYLVIDVERSDEFYTVSDLDALVKEWYEDELENNSLDVLRGWFLQSHKVFVSEDKIVEVCQKEKIN